MNDLTPREIISMHMMQAIVTGYLPAVVDELWEPDGMAVYALELTDALIKANNEERPNAD